jgi:hypothetical protein
MEAPKQKKWVATRYWRLIFTPLIFVLVLFAFYVILTASPANTASSISLSEIINSIQPRQAVNVGNV